MARLLMCRDNRSPLLPWQAPYSGRGYPGPLALLQGAGSSPLAGAHANHHAPRGRAKRRKQKGARVEPARDFAQRQLQCVDQIQWRYELSRPLVLCAEGTPTQRAEDTHTPPDTVRTFLRRFRQEGMRGLLPTAIAVAPRPRASRVPEAVQQDMARRKALDNDLQYREIVRLIFYTCGYRLHPKTAQRLWQQSQPAIQEALALGASHSQGARYQARVHVITLSDQGWPKRRISRGFHGSRPPIDRWMHRCAAEPCVGLVDKSCAPKAPARKVWLPLRLEV
jgi:hypothetical protein